MVNNFQLNSVNGPKSKPYNSFETRIYRDVSSNNLLQIVSKFSTIININSTGIARLVLTPESLGTVFVEVNTTNSKTEFLFRSKNNDTLKQLENRIDELKNLLSRNGIENIEYRFEKQYQTEQEDLLNKRNSNNNNNNNSNQKNSEHRFAPSFAKEVQDEPEIAKENAQKIRFLRGRIIEKYV